jgi:hypothetical protein
MSTIITPESFNASQLTVSQIKVNEKTGAKSCYINYAGGPIMVQTAMEMRSPYGLNTYVGPNGEKADNPDYSIDISLDGYNDESSEIGQYYKMMTSFGDFAKGEAVKNRVAWFKDKDFELRDANKKFSPLVKFPVDKDGNPKPYPPTQKIKLSLTGDIKNRTKFYNPDGEALTDPVDKILAKGTTITMILRCGGLWFAAGQFGITWRAAQVVVHKIPDSVADFAFVGFAGARAAPAPRKAAPAAAVEDTSYSNQVDDDEEAAALSRPLVANSAASAFMPVPKAAQPNPFENVDVSGDGEDVEPANKPKPITKKKLMIGKK